MAGALKNKVNYYGTDPNYLLCDKLVEFAHDYKSTQLNKRNMVATHIKCQGSEKYVPEWENKMGLAFSSPPYFLLEDYRVGEQSYKEGETTYESWLNDYMLPTFKNIHKYLIDNGFFVCNIKDFGKYSLEKDTIKCAELAGFYLYKIETLKNNARVASVGGGDFVVVDNDEKIFVFAKNGQSPIANEVEQLSLLNLI